MPENKIRGSILKGYAKYIKKMWGQTGLDQCSLAINFYLHTVVQGKWYDSDIDTRMLRWINDKHGMEYVVRAGNYTVKDLGILSYLLRFASIETLLKKAPQHYSQAFDYGEVEIHITGKSAEIIMKDIAVSEFACPAWLGGMKGMLELTKTKGTVKETQCQLKGAPYCVFTMEWEEYRRCSD